MSSTQVSDHSTSVTVPNDDVEPDENTLFDRTFVNSWQTLETLGLTFGDLDNFDFDFPVEVVGDDVAG
jgi:hypothetical protein